jgi:hypothetical protein
MSKRWLPTLCTALALAAPGAPLPAQVFDFEAAPLGLMTPPPFSLSSGGLTATFSALREGTLPNQVGVIDASFLPPLGGNSPAISGQFLLATVEDPAGPMLQIDFSAPRTALAFAFEGSNDGYSLIAYRGGTPVGSTTGFGTPVAGLPLGDPALWQGTLSFVGAPFTSVVIAGANPSSLGADSYLALDRLAVSAVPEPSAAVLLAAGLLAGGATVRRWRARGTS